MEGMEEGMVAVAQGIEDGNGAQQALLSYRLTEDHDLDSGLASTGMTDPEPLPKAMTRKKGKVRIGTINITSGYGKAAENLHTVAKDCNAMHLDVILVTETRIGSEQARTAQR